ncbi:unnamed protein product [Arctogadus glacialis]
MTSSAHLTVFQCCGEEVNSPGPEERRMERPLKQGGSFASIWLWHVFVGVRDTKKCVANPFPHRPPLSNLGICALGRGPAPEPLEWLVAGRSRCSTPLGLEEKDGL